MFGLHQTPGSRVLLQNQSRNSSPLKEIEDTLSCSQDPWLHPTLSQINLIHALSSSLSKIQFNIILPLLSLGYHGGSLSMLILPLGFCTM
jgi:hypothetical protein